MKLLTVAEVDELRRSVISLVTEVGLRVEHEQVRALLLGAGCRPAVDGRVLFLSIY